MPRELKEEINHNTSPDGVTGKRGWNMTGKGFLHLSTLIEKDSCVFQDLKTWQTWGKKNHITSLLDLKGKCMIGNYSSRSCAQECGGRTRTMTMLSAQIFHRPETESINFSTTQEQMPRTQWDLGRSEASSKLQALWKGPGQNHTSVPASGSRLQQSLWEREPHTTNPPENSPHGGYTVDELFRLIWQPGWKNYFNWLQAQDPTLQLRAGSAVPKTVKNYFSRSWLDGLQKNTYTHKPTEYSHFQGLLRWLKVPTRKKIYGVELYSTPTHSGSVRSKNLNVLFF